VSKVAGMVKPTAACMLWYLVEYMIKEKVRVPVISHLYKVTEFQSMSPNIVLDPRKTFFNRVEVW